MLEPGTLLNRSYVIERRVASGGSGNVYRAHARADASRVFALKELPRGEAAALGETVEERVMREMRLMARVDHPAIARMVEVFSSGSYLYVVSEFVEGRTLQSVVRQEGAQPPARVVAWGAELCAALGHLHGLTPPVIHRDVKPGNILLTPAGALKLVDLGIAREYDAAREAGADTTALGTRGYAPPEQYGRSQTDARSDIYALGCTLWFALAGKEPPVEFPLPSIRGENAQVSVQLDHVIQTCTALDRAHRYQNCAELAAALSACSESDSALSRGSGMSNAQEAPFFFTIVHDEVVTHTTRSLPL